MARWRRGQAKRSESGVGGYGQTGLVRARRWAEGELMGELAARALADTEAARGAVERALAPLARPIRLRLLLRAWRACTARDFLSKETKGILDARKYSAQMERWSLKNPKLATALRMSKAPGWEMNPIAVALRAPSPPPRGRQPDAFLREMAASWPRDLLPVVGPRLDVLHPLCLWIAPQHLRDRNHVSERFNAFRSAVEGTMAAAEADVRLYALAVALEHKYASRRQPVIAPPPAIFSRPL